MHPTETGLGGAQIRFSKEDLKADTANMYKSLKELCLTETKSFFTEINNGIGPILDTPWLHQLKLLILANKREVVYRALRSMQHHW